MRKTKSTVVALSTVAALLATGGAAAAVATTGDDASPASSGTAQAGEQTQTKAGAGDGAEEQGDGQADEQAQGGKELRGHHKRLAQHAPKGDGAKVLCKRAPKIDKRIDRLQRRLDAGVRVRGSVDRLEKRVENARKAGHGVIASFLGDRLEDRRELKVRLKDREDGLKKVRVWCAKQDEGKSGSDDEKKSGGSGESGASAES
ncbi:hypothetical protein K378_04203 [Streptomyces sp. Amel2xB2]|uniref:hypothetical protein n=1 Tax=Streptomyces sp. Amel2xB2 TaxID=1305829 RepID=UPI000DBA5FA0|nr:hypothetical protein [Streptomyces sp. Amel2xB2]RAJ61839.1 hypothetical protein K378_04203 [Streptomyces sp. Amel2xB2]